MFFSIIDILKNLFCFTGSYSNDVFPEPLDPIEEEKCIKGKMNGNMDDRNKLIEHNLRLVAHIIKKFDNKYVDSDDLISIGTIGLIKGVDTFSSDKGVKITTYCARCIENEILMYLRRSNKIKSEISIDEPLNQDGDGNELLLSDILGSDADTVSRGLEEEVDKKLLRTAISKLSTREKNIMELRFGFVTGDEKTQKEVADMMGISKSYISRLEKKIINKMKKDILSKTS